LQSGLDLASGGRPLFVAEGGSISTAVRVGDEQHTDARFWKRRNRLRRLDRFCEGLFVEVNWKCWLRFWHPLPPYLKLCVEGFLLVERERLMIIISASPSRSQSSSRLPDRFHQPIAVFHEIEQQLKSLLTEVLLLAVPFDSAVGCIKALFLQSDTPDYPAPS
jgi:hypothetical protein